VSLLCRGVNFKSSVRGEFHIVSHMGWVYPMDYIEGAEGTWGAISEAPGEVSDRSLYREGFADRHQAAAWLLVRRVDGGPSVEGR